MICSVSTIVTSCVWEHRTARHFPVKTGARCIGTGPGRTSQARTAPKSGKRLGLRASHSGNSSLSMLSRQTGALAAFCITGASLGAKERASDEKLRGRRSWPSSACYWLVLPVPRLKSTTGTVSCPWLLDCVYYKHCQKNTESKHHC